MIVTLVPWQFWHKLYHFWTFWNFLFFQWTMFWETNWRRFLNSQGVFSSKMKYSKLINYSIDMWWNHPCTMVFIRSRLQKGWMIHPFFFHVFKRMELKSPFSYSHVANLTISLVGGHFMCNELMIRWTHVLVWSWKSSPRKTYVYFISDFNKAIKVFGHAWWTPPPHWV